MHSATGKGARGVKRRPNTGAQPAPHQIRTPGTCGPRARAKGSGASHSDRGVSGALRLGLQAPAVSASGESRFKSFSRGPRSVLRLLAWSFVEMTFFKYGEFSSPRNPPHPPTSQPLFSLDESTDQWPLFGPTSIRAFRQQYSNCPQLTQLGGPPLLSRMFLGSGRGCLSPRR